MERPVIIIMTRWHGENRCKKRLAKSIGPNRAAKIQKLLSHNIISVVKQLERTHSVEIRLAISGVSYNYAQRWGAQLNIHRVLLQGEGTLGLRIRRQILKAQTKRPYQRKKGRPTIVIGSDIPNISHLDLAQAIEILQTNDMVLGPSSDGGYWLIGLSNKLVAPVAIWPFYEINWGTNKVLNQTIKKATSQAISYKYLREQNDLDELEDLRPWQK